MSAVVGVKKPAPEIYHLACARLGVAPEECVYVGDGSSHELDGARAVGMHPVLIRVTYGDGPDTYRIEEQPWTGRRIAALAEVLDIVAEGRR